MLKLFSKVQTASLLLLVLFSALFGGVGAASSVFGVTNPGYRGLSYTERSVSDAGAVDGIRVNTYSGNLTIQRNLLVVPGKGIPLELYLTYNSDHRNISSPFGLGWNLSYNIRYTRDSSSNVTIVWGDGRQDVFTRNGGAYTAPAGVYMTLTEPTTGKMLLTAKRGIKFRFTDSVHRKLTSIEDPNGNALTFGYNTSYRLATITDAGGRVYNLSYDAKGKLTGITDPNLAGGRTYTLAYDTAGRLTGITDPLGKTEAFSYNTENLLIGITDRKGNAASIAYVTPGWNAGTRIPQGISKAAGGTTATDAYAFNNTTMTTNVTDPNSNLWKYDYNPAGDLAVITNPKNKTAMYTWDVNNNPLAVTDWNGNTNSSTYDVNGNPLTVTDPLAKTETRAYGVLNRVMSFTDRNGNTTSYTYDTNGNLLTVTDPLTKVTTFVNDAAGQPTSIANPLSETTQVEYDANGNLKKLTDPLSAVTSITYDGAGRSTNITDPNGNSRQRAYDKINRITSSTDGIGNSAQYVYDDNNNLTSLTDRNGEVWGFTYNALDFLTNGTNSLGNNESYSYDAMGNLISFVDMSGSTTGFTYDELSRMATKTSPLSQVYQVTYDDNGNPVSLLDPNGQTVSFAYDSNNRRVTRTLPGPDVTTYGYDNNGNLLSASNAGSTISRTYDARNMVLTINDDQLNKTLTLSYNAAGRKISANNPEGDMQTYNHDAAGNVTRITAGGEDFDYTYDTGHRRKTFVRTDSPGGLATTYGYDAADRNTSVTTTNSGSTVQSFAYVYDANGNTTRETREDATTSVMTYNDANQLVRERRTGSPAYDINYTRDALGNRLTVTGTPFFPTSPLTFTYDAANQVVQETGTQWGGAYTRGYTYNNNGNLTQKLGTNISTVDYAYDPLNRITSADDSGSGAENYAYNAWDQLNKIVVPSPVAGEPGTQRFFYDERGNVIASYDASGNLIEQFWHNRPGGFGNAFRRPFLQRVYDTYLKHKEENEPPTYPITDINGNTTCVIALSGIDKKLFTTEGGIVSFGNGFKNFDINDGGKNNRDRINSNINRGGKVFDRWNNPGKANQIGGAGVNSHFANLMNGLIMSASAVALGMDLIRGAEALALMMNTLQGFPYYVPVVPVVEVAAVAGQANAWANAWNNPGGANQTWWGLMPYLDFQSAMSLYVFHGPLDGEIDKRTRILHFLLLASTLSQVETAPVIGGIKGIGNSYESIDLELFEHRVPF